MWKGWLGESDLVQSVKVETESDSVPRSKKIDMRRNRAFKFYFQTFKKFSFSPARPHNFLSLSSSLSTPKQHVPTSKTTIQHHY